MPALSHFWISGSIRGSPIRCSRNLVNQDWLTSSKKLWTSTSSIQFTFVLVIPTTKASSASCWLRFRIQHRGNRPLDDLVFEGGNRDRTLSAVGFWYV